MSKLKTSDRRKWVKQRMKADTAEALAFIDRKTAYPLVVLICPHSVSGADTKKAIMKLITEWGLPKKWYMDNGREFINDEVIQFLYGVYSNEMEFLPGATNQKIVMLKDEHLLETSISYQPYGKGRMERQFRTWKDEHCGYSPSYSPNQVESRKPTLALSAVQPTKDFNELAQDLHEYIYGEFINKPRPKMFEHPGYTSGHEINKNRPQTIKEAFDIAYANYERVSPDKFLLAYHYADKLKKTYKKGAIEFTYNSIKLQYIPTVEGFEAMSRYAGKKNAITVLMDPENIFHCWLFDGKRLLCEAKDLRYEKNIGIGKDRAAHIKKLQNAAIRVEKRRKKILAEKELVVPKWREENKIEDIVPMAHSSEVSVGVLGELIDTSPSESITNMNGFSDKEDLGAEIDVEIHTKPLSGYDLPDWIFDED